MTLLWALQQLPMWFPSSKHNHDMIVHYLGKLKVCMSFQGLVCLANEFALC